VAFFGRWRNWRKSRRATAVRFSTSPPSSPNETIRGIRGRWSTSRPCAIATFGLITDSAVAIIGAMLVAPLMSPILELSLASVAGKQQLSDHPSVKNGGPIERNALPLHHLIALYGETAGRAAFERLRAMMRRYAARPSPPRGRAVERLSERDVILITYGDQVQSLARPPLRVLADFCHKHLAGLVSGIHVLPFYPWTSDDGFSVKNYRTVDAALGDWKDIARLGRCFRLMLDAVINHVSATHPWFKGFLLGNPRFQNHFVVVEGDPDLSQVVRPRALPLLTKFQTPSGEKAVWTTFSEDQIDLNYANPDVLLEIIDTLLFYVSRDAEFIRLDAIAYLWKEIGTPCIHLPQTHRIVQLFRAVLDEVAPHVMLITETNVPHADNVSYFGDGHNEAQLVYNFALPPLVLHTLRTGNARALSEWAATLRLPSSHTTFFNFLASHDGIGLNPARGILPQSDIDALVQQTLDHSGLVSYKHNPDGSQSPYELNINYFDALNNPNNHEALELQADRFMAAQAIMLSLVGVPGIYFHSLFGSRGWPEGAQLTGRNRTINRQKCDRAELEHELARLGSLRRMVFANYKQLLKARARSRAFHPHGLQRILDYGDAVFALVRLAPESSERGLYLQNVTRQPQSIAIDLEDVLGLAPRGGWAVDLITRQRFSLRRRDAPVPLRPYQTLWLVREKRTSAP
jgi:sucrose phosphorylase